MAQNKLFSAVGFIFLALVFIPEIQSVEGRYLKFLSEKLNTHKRFLARETEKGIEGESSFHAVDVQSPPPAVTVGASEPPPARHVDDFRPAAEGIERESSFQYGAGVQSSPPPAAVMGASEPPPARHVDEFRPAAERGIEIEGSFHEADVQSPPPGASFGASEPRHVDEFRPAAEKGIERECSFHAADVQSSPPPAAAIGASEPPPARHVDDFRPATPDHNPCIGCHYIEAAHANAAFSNEEKVDPLPPPPPHLNHPIHH
ncbi:hypothetical protein SLA2020_071410 [Shorea laevis]